MFAGGNKVDLGQMNQGRWHFGCFTPSKCQHFHCNTTGKAIKEHKSWHTIQQNEHTLGQSKSVVTDLNISRRRLPIGAGHGKWKIKPQTRK